MVIEMRLSIVCQHGAPLPAFRRRDVDTGMKGAFVSLHGETQMLSPCHVDRLGADR